MAHASTHGARKHAWRTQARMLHANRLGQNMDYNPVVFNQWNIHVWRTQARLDQKPEILYAYHKIEIWIFQKHIEGH